jgi:hypothetical protein
MKLKGNTNINVAAAAGAAAAAVAAAAVVAMSETTFRSQAVCQSKLRQYHIFVCSNPAYAACLLHDNTYQ